MLSKKKKLYLNFETENKELKSFAVLFDGKVYISTDEELFVKFIADSELEKLHKKHQNALRLCR